MRTRPAVLAIGTLLALAPSPKAQHGPDCGTNLSRAQAALQATADSTWLNVTSDYSPGEVVYVPVAFHIVRHSKFGGFDPGNLLFAITNLNETWADSDIRFFGVGPLDIIESDVLFAIEGDPELNQLKQMNVVADAINVYCVDSLPNGACGVSSFTSYAVQGIVMDNDCMPPINKSTLTHEIGHYFDLYHTHETIFGNEKVNGSNCGTAGDKLCDTPADPNLSGNVNDQCTYTGSFVDSNGQPYSPLTDNIMSYSLKECRDDFTIEQVNRALDRLLTHRPELIHPPWPGLGDTDGNLVVDSYEIIMGLAADDNSNGIPDSAEGTLSLRVAESASPYDATGTNWGHPYPLDVAFEVVDQLGFSVALWLKAGTYRPAGPNGEATASFELEGGIKLFGGFAGTETQLDQQDPVANLTIMDGDLNNDDDSGVPGSSGENSHHVVVVHTSTFPVLMDGLTISGGHATGMTGWDGAGVFVQPGGILQMVECVLRDNTTRWLQLNPPPTFMPSWGGGAGGGLYGATGSSLELENCTFTRNLAADGAGVAISAGSIVATDCHFIDNDGGYSGAVLLSGSIGTFVNCTFVDGGLTSGSEYIGEPVRTSSSELSMDRCLVANNRSSKTSGIALVGAALANITRCTLANNLTDHATAPAIDTEAGDAQIRETVLWGNRNGSGGGEEAQIHLGVGQLDWCAIEGWSGQLAGTGSSGAAPYFQDPLMGDYRLAHGSLLIDAGDPNSPMDPDGSAADIGAFAFDPSVFDPWTDLGYSLLGTGGWVPQLSGLGSGATGSQAAIHLVHSYPGSPAALFTSIQSPFTPSPVPFKGGSLIANPLFSTLNLVTNPSGEVFLPLFESWPGLPTDTVLVFQIWINDPGAVAGASASNGLLFDDGR